MNHVASGMVLKEVAPNIPAVCRHVQNPLRMKIRAMGAGETLLTLDHIQTAGKSTRCQFRRHQPMVGRLTRVKRFTHRSEHGLKPSRLSSGDPKGDGEFVLIETQQMRTGGRRAKASDRGRGVKAEPVI